MPTDPRTPAVVAVGQVTHRPSGEDPASLTDPVSLMASALRAAGDDAGGTALLERLDVLVAVPSFVWSDPDPAGVVAARLGVTVGATRRTFPGGTVPQRAVFDAARRIAAGECDVVAIVGAEAMRSRELARRLGVRPEWPTEPGAEPAPLDYEVPDALSDHERSLGLALPVLTYALFEHALRRAKGLDRAAHRELLLALSERQRAVASANPHAWLRDGAGPALPETASNRLVALPYTKLLASNVAVDMGAAVVVASVEAARRAGVDDAHLVFPVAGAHAKEQWYVSERLELSRSLAMAACARALRCDGGAPGVQHLDLYSCFPCAVQLACDAVGIDPVHDERATTVTGGMTYFGGPGNNYVTHSIATMAQRLRERPGSTGLVTGLGWYASTHAWCTYSTTPPTGGFRVADAQAEVDAAPLRAVDPDFEGDGELETYTVGYERDGTPTRVVAAVRTPAGARRLLGADDAALAAELVDADPLGTRVAVRGGRLELT